MILFAAVLAAIVTAGVDGLGDDGSYRIGLGIADITGPAAEVPMMGYANPSQTVKGIHMRLYARCYIIDDGDSRVVFVSTDSGMIGTAVRMMVNDRLRSRFGNTYPVKNVIISGTHTHSGPGGFLQYMLFAISTKGFIQQSADALVGGIVRCIERAHYNIHFGKIYFNKGELLGTNINRSPTAYINNPASERGRYPYDVDKDMSQLNFIDDDGTPLGLINWFAVHATSMNNTNELISGDNKGYAEYAFEKDMNPGVLPGRGPFVAAFASSNLGDVSPNILGPHCLDTGLPCELRSSSCNGNSQLCVASGPGKDQFESTKIIGERMYLKAKELFNDKNQEPVRGRVRFIHQFVNMTEMVAETVDPATNTVKKIRACPPAMGYSFAAGTTDGPGLQSFRQGTLTGNPLWDMFRNILHEPTKEQIECQGRKPILLDVGSIKYPFEWLPSIIDTQIVMIGNVAIVPVPAEFTTMSGRRLREAVQQTIAKNGGGQVHVVLAGLANSYSDYVATNEEYQMQRYEGASTIYGPNTLDLYIYQYKKLAKALVRNENLPAGPMPPNYLKQQINLNTGVFYDGSGYGRNYGDCIKEPPQVVAPGETISAVFVSGHPRNNLMQERTFVNIECLIQDQWQVVANDANWETKFYWERERSILGTSNITVEYTVPVDTQASACRIRIYGYAKRFFGGADAYEGTTMKFEINPSRNMAYSRSSGVASKSWMNPYWSTVRDAVSPYGHTFSNMYYRYRSQ